MATPLFEERQSFAAIKTMSLIAIVFAIVWYIAGTKTKVEIFAVGIVIFIGLLMMAGFRNFKTEVTATALRFGFPLYRKRLSLSGLEVGEIRPIRFWYGWGVHYIRGIWVWNARLGRGVLVQSGGKKYLIGSEQPERLQSVLRERISVTARS